MQSPRLFCLSTVCLLKHYNQDYPLHSLRTDFTGPNGVGKSIIADLFQLVFIAESKYIKFATEGIDSKKRKIEKLPFQSGVAYTFFSVEVIPGKFVVIGAAIFAQGNTLVKPFIITLNIDYSQTALEDNCFGAEKVPLSRDFLKRNGEPFALDELSADIPSRLGLHLHYFSTKDERNNYYDWLYRNHLIPINLVKENNLKSYAKVIQSFSKSKFLEIDNSHKLIEYLFEENEHEIENEFRQQEQGVQELLYQFRSMKENIVLIKSKQGELRKLKELDAKRKDEQFKLFSSDYLYSQQNVAEKEKAWKKLEHDIEQKKTSFERITNRKEQFAAILRRATDKAAQLSSAYDKLVKSRKIFEAIDTHRRDLDLIGSIETNCLFRDLKLDATKRDGLLKKDASFFYESIDKNRESLLRYDSVQAIDTKKQQQDIWLKERVAANDELVKNLKAFKVVLETVDEKSLFVKGLGSINGKVKDFQKVILLYLRDMSLGKPTNVTHKVRYTDSLSILNENNLAVDEVNNGWWLKMGDVHEFISKTSSILSTVPQINGNNLKTLTEAIKEEMALVVAQGELYENLSKGVMDTSITKEVYDVDLSDFTKVKELKLAAALCALLQDKTSMIKSAFHQNVEVLNGIKSEFHVTDDDLEFETLIDKIVPLKEHFNGRKERISNQFTEEQNELKALQTAIPALDANKLKLRAEYFDEMHEFTQIEGKFSDAFPEIPFPIASGEIIEYNDIQKLEESFRTASENYLALYNQIIGQFEETKMQRDLRINEQIDKKSYSFDVLEATLLGRKIRALDHVTDYLETLNIDLLNIADELLRSITKVFGKTEKYYDSYKLIIQSLNSFFRGHLISNRFYFKINFLINPKLDIKWIEQLRKSAYSLVNSTGPNAEFTPEQFVETFYSKYSGTKERVVIRDLLNPKKYFVLKGELTDEKNNVVPGSTGESYTAISLLGIARLSIVQDGDRAGLRFIILEESATLDSVNFSIFPQIAEKYGYQIITMTPKPYSVGDENGWYIHHLLPGKENPDVNYPKIISYFRTVSSSEDLNTYLKMKGL